MSPEEFRSPLPATERRGILSGLVRLNRYLLLLLIPLAGIIGFWPPYKDLEYARQRLGEQELLLETLKEKSGRLKKKLELLSTDPAYLEAMARDRLLLQKDGEMVFRFED